DLMMYGENLLPEHPDIIKVKGDIRDKGALKNLLPGHDAVIHLACISNDPSYELNPRLGKSINYDSFEPLVAFARDSGVKRFVYASSSSVYGIKSEPDVTEEMPLEPLTDYSKYKAQCEDILQTYQSDEFTTVTIRPATVCGYSPRLRLDLTVNILTNHAITNSSIKVFGGSQKRPNVHIKDMVDVYAMLLEAPKESIGGKIFNAGYENHSVSEIAGMVRNVIGSHVDIVTEKTEDNRSYHISSNKIFRELGFKPRHTIEEAVSDLKRAFEEGLVPNPMDNPRYYNVRLMKQIQLT
ncbi:NAD-dependent epimerase/dehydratase family protein, partial [Fibrobacterota bacterium]